MGKRELVALLSLSSRCLLMVVWLFLAVPWVFLRFVVVVFPDHTHLLSLTAFYWYQIFALDSAVVEVQAMFSSHGGLLTITMYHHG